MKLLGKTPSGDAIVAIEPAWIAALKNAIGSLEIACLENAPAPVAIAPAGPVVRQKRPMCSKPAVKDKSKECVICGKPFRPKTSEVTCSEACWKVRKNQQKSASAGKPVVPNAVDKAARLALLRSLNNKLDVAPTKPDAYAPADPNEA